jgi:hypothetical protein
MKVSVNVTKRTYGQIVFDIDLPEKLTLRQKKNMVQRKAIELIEQSRDNIEWFNDPWYTENDRDLAVDYGYYEMEE